ncbi:MAG: hypothetical protein O9249_00060 [Burkholderiaceae bacterium]|nr:hypothetical protein [Burkholderiaceae bacterium]
MNFCDTRETEISLHAVFLTAEIERSLRKRQRAFDQETLDCHISSGQQLPIVDLSEIYVTSSCALDVYPFDLADVLEKFHDQGRNLILGNGPPVEQEIFAKTGILYLRRKEENRHVMGLVTTGAEGIRTRRVIIFYEDPSDVLFGLDQWVSERVRSITTSAKQSGALHEDGQVPIRKPKEIRKAAPRPLRKYKVMPLTVAEKRRKPALTVVPTTLDLDGSPTL